MVQVVEECEKRVHVRQWGETFEGGFIQGGLATKLRGQQGCSHQGRVG